MRIVAAAFTAVLAGSALIAGAGPAVAQEQVRGLLDPPPMDDSPGMRVSATPCAAFHSGQRSVRAPHRGFGVR